LPWDGDYVFEFRFLDGTSGCGFRVKLNGSVFASVVYNGTSEIVIYGFVVENARRGIIVWLLSCLEVFILLLLTI